MLLIPRIPNIRKLVLNGWMLNASNQQLFPLDFVPLTKLEHLDARDSYIDRIALPSSLRFLASQMSRPIRPVNADQDPLRNLTTLICGTLRQVVGLLEIHSSAPDDSVTPPPSSLETLHVTSAEADSYTILPVQVLTRLHRLKDLQLRGIRNFDAAWALHIAKVMPEITRLDLSRSDATGFGIRMAVEALKDLKFLDVTECQSLGIDAIELVKARGVQVRYGMQETNKGGKKVRY